ncbi:spore maturation protein CgeB [Singulisphaera sp. GP187]|uniref:CgeB family protein n=1 Tax=Singulisphaera sp. GP187 TaxID=1882752 RepID=UPI00092A1251|nr:glycosyltransferase [Singulisphaera sp. GP187]SIO55313.1 spore maturation protein CgeB [Singulisphaera sp. GP187]
MKISVIGKQFSDSLAHNLSFTLKQMGMEVQEIDEDRAFERIPFRRRLRSIFAIAESHPRLLAVRDRLIHRELAQFKPHIVLNTYRDWGPRAIARARDVLGRTAKIAFLYPDAFANLARMFPLGADYDALFFKDPFGVDMFRSRLGLNAHYLPEACNPSWHFPVELTPEDRARYGCDLTTAGNMYYYRARLLSIFEGYDLKLYGPPLPKWLESPLRANYTHVYVSEVEKSKAFRAAKITINTLHPTEILGVNVRAFEAAGCGAFQIADWRPEMETMFRIDEEIVVYRSRDELKEKVDYYLSRPEQRAKIAEAGCRRAHGEHTYRHRLEHALKIVDGC